MKEAKRRTGSATFLTRFSPRLGGEFITKKSARLLHIVIHLCTLDGTGGLRSFLQSIFLGQFPKYKKYIFSFPCKGSLANPNPPIRFQTNTSQKDSHIPLQPPDHKFQGAGRACGTWSSAWMDARYGLITTGQVSLNANIDHV